VLPYLAFAACCGVIVWYATRIQRNLMNVESTDLTRRFGRTQAVAGVTMETGPGVFGLLGPNAAGKTTTIGVLTTRVRATSGRALIAGIDVSKDPSPSSAPWRWCRSAATWTAR
jgi:ABC-type branched-subunit amino acid transport system ATPase component